MSQAATKKRYSVLSPFFVLLLLYGSVEGTLPSQPTQWYCTQLQFHPKMISNSPCSNKLSKESVKRLISKGIINSSRHKKRGLQQKTRNDFFVHLPTIIHSQPTPLNHTFYSIQPTKKFHNTSIRCYQTSKPHCLAVDINVGHGPQSFQPSPQSPPISPEQRKAADLELERMKLSTENIVSTLSRHESATNDSKKQGRSQISNAFINEVKVTFNYWTSRWIIHYHPYVTASPTNVTAALKPRLDQTSINGTDTKTGIQVLDDSLYSDYGTNQAMSILKALLGSGDVDLIRRTLFANNGNAAFASLIESILLPCTTNFTRMMNDGNYNIGNFKKDNDSVDSTLKGQQNNILATDVIPSSKNLDASMNHVYFSSSTGLHNLQPSIWKACIIDACQMIDLMNDLQQECDIRPDTNSYNAKLFTWFKLATLLQLLKYQDHSGGLNKNTGLIRWDEDSRELSQYTLHHNQMSLKQSEDGLSQVLSASLQMQSVDEVISNMEEVLTIMENSDECVKPNLNTYITVINAISRSDSSDAAYRAEWYLKRMERTEDIELNLHDLKSDHDENDFPRTYALADVSTYNLVFNAFASASSSKSNVIDADLIERAKRADEILQRMEERYERIQREEARPDVLSYSTILNCYANAGMATEAEEILNKMIAISNEDSNGDGVRPNIICFNTVIDAWARTRGFDSADKAYAVLSLMENLAETREDLYPDTITYSAVISTFARSGREDAGDRAEELLQRSLHLYKKEGRVKLRPDSITFITVLDALSKQSLRVFQKRRNMAECHSIEQRMKKILKQMDELDDNVRPCTVSHNVLLDLYAKTLQSEKAEHHLMEHMVKSYQSGNQNVKPDIISYNSLLLALSRSPQQGSLEKAQQLLKSMEDGTLPDGIDVQPDVISYNSIITGCKRNINRSSIYMAHDLLLHMEERYRNGLSTVKPNNITYNILLDAWSKSKHPDTMNQVHDLLEKMIDSDTLQPDVFSFSSVISTLASSGRNDVPEQAQKLIKRMESLNIKPNRITYNSLINCWSKSGRRGAAEKAEEILIQMTEMDDPDSTPDAISFSSVINCWAQSGEEGCGERAQAILDMMESNWRGGNKNMKPNRFTYASVLNAFAKGRDESSLNKALFLLERMKQSYLEGNDEARPTEPGCNAGKSTSM